MKKMLGLAVATMAVVALLSTAPASATSYPIFTLTACEGCAGHNVSVNFESNGLPEAPSITAYAFALALNPKTGRYEGPGMLEARIAHADGTDELVARDPIANFSVLYGSDGGCPTLESIVVEGQAMGSGQFFGLEAARAPYPADPCVNQKLTGALEIGQGKGSIKKSFGFLKNSTR